MPSADISEFIDREELAQLALDLANIDSPPGREKEVAEFVEAWLRQEGFRTKVLTMIEDRPNVVGVYDGTGGGYSLLFNSHMDTVVSPDEVWSYRNCMEPIHHGAWREHDTLYGNSIVNDKGPMACFLIAAKAIKKGGIKLKGDLILTAVSGEVALEPVDEFQPYRYPGQAIGTGFIVTHGAIADYAIVAEATNFRFAWVEAGKVFLKVTIFGGPKLYTPYIRRPYALEEHPNAIVRMTKLIEKIDEWALAYEKKHTYICPGGTLIPKVAIGAIRGGAPYHPDGTSELCSLYLDLRTAPGQDMLAVRAEIRDIVQSLGLEGDVEFFVTEPGYEAQSIDHLADAIGRAHRKLFNEEPQPVVGPECSMWRDINFFNQAGIPSLTYGPSIAAGERKYAVRVDDLYKAAQIYAMVTLDLCNQEKIIQ